jgi:hypothetical protein
MWSKKAHGHGRKAGESKRAKMKYATDAARLTMNEKGAARYAAAAPPFTAPTQAAWPARASSFRIIRTCRNDRDVVTAPGEPRRNFAGVFSDTQYFRRKVYADD